jgi:hypothetical protein
MNDQYWYELGNHAIILKDMCQYITMMTCRTHGKSHSYHNIIYRVDKLFGKVRSDLDDIVCGLYPREQHSLTLYPNIALTQVFYGDLPETNPYLPYPNYQMNIRPLPKVLSEDQRTFVDTFKNALLAYLVKVSSNEFTNTYISNIKKIVYMKNINSLRNYLDRL